MLTEATYYMNEDIITYLVNAWLQNIIVQENILTDNI